MDDELKAKLLTYLNEVEAAAATGKDFLAEQAPLYVQELIAFTFCEAVIYAVAQAVVVLFLWVAYAVTWFAFRKDKETALAIGCIGGALACILSLFLLFPPAQDGKAGLIHNATLAVKCKVAPRVVIVDKLREAMK